MRQYHLERAVARATGDDFAFIHNRGFSIVEDASALTEDDLNEIVRDWDRIQQEIDEHDHGQSHWRAAVVRASHVRNSNPRRPRRLGAGYLARSTKAAH